MKTRKIPSDTVEPAETEPPPSENGLKLAKAERVIGFASKTDVGASGGRGRTLCFMEGKTRIMAIDFYRLAKSGHSILFAAFACGIGSVATAQSAFTHAFPRARMAESVSEIPDLILSTSAGLIEGASHTSDSKWTSAQVERPSWVSDSHPETTGELSRTDEGNTDGGRPVGFPSFQLASDIPPDSVLQDSDYVSDEEYESADVDKAVRELKYGEPTVSQARAFLRTQTPLLRSGQVQVDFGTQYSVFESDFPTLVAGNLTDADVRSRRLESLLGFRYGLTSRAQLFAATSLGWNDVQTSDGTNHIEEDDWGLGDTLFGINYLLRNESDCNPALIFSFDISAPTGDDPDPLLLTDAGLGSGVWATSSRFLMIRSLDPVVLFWGAGYRHTFEDSFGANRIDLGNQFLYNCGVGFAANERVTLSTSYDGAYVSDLVVNDNELEGSAFDLGSLRFAATILQCDQILEPFVQIGTTEQTPSTTFGIVLTR